MKIFTYSIRTKMVFVVVLLFTTTAFMGYKLYDTQLAATNALKDREEIYRKDEQVSYALYHANIMSVLFNKFLLGQITRSDFLSGVTMTALEIERMPPDMLPDMGIIQANVRDANLALRSPDKESLLRAHELILLANQKIHSVVPAMDAEIENLRTDAKAQLQAPEGSLYLLTISLSLILALITLAVSEIFLPLARINRILLKIGEGKSCGDELAKMASVKGEVGQAHKALSDLLYKLATTVSDLEKVNENHQKKISAIEASKGGIGITDSCGKLIFGNQALFEIHGIPPEQADMFIGHPSINLYSPGDRAHFFEKLLAMRKEGFWQGEADFLGHDGKGRSGDFSLTKLPDNSFIWTVIDISARKYAEKEKENAEALFMQAQKMEAIGRLTGGIAHDFNNMLTIVQGNLELLQKTAIQHAPKAQLFAESALRAIRRSSELTNHLLSFSRKQFLQPKNLVLNKFLPETSILLSRALGEKIDLIMNLSSDKAIVYADPGQLETAILNLAINAKDAMDDGGEIILSTETITFAASRNLGHAVIPPGDYVRISVRDNGHGMDSQTLTRIFEPFFTTKEMGKGTGLGLSMVYGFVNQSRGFIDVESAPGSGTCFSLYFPLAHHKEDGDARPVPAAVHSEQNILTQRQGKILIAEDEDDLRELNRNLLINLGYSVLCAQDGNEALNLLKDNHDIDMILSDVIMPGLSGMDLAIEAKKIHSDIRILLTSGYTDEIDVSEKEREGLGFLAKPYSQSRLASEIDMIMKEKSGGSLIA